MGVELAGVRLQLPAQDVQDPRPRAGPWTRCSPQPALRRRAAVTAIPQVVVEEVQRAPWRRSRRAPPLAEPHAEPARDQPLLLLPLVGVHGSGPVEGQRQVAPQQPGGLGDVRRREAGGRRSSRRRPAPPRPSPAARRTARGPDSGAASRSSNSAAQRVLDGRRERRVGPPRRCARTSRRAARSSRRWSSARPVPRHRHLEQRVPGQQLGRGQVEPPQLGRASGPPPARGNRLRILAAAAGSIGSSFLARNVR